MEPAYQGIDVTYRSEAQKADNKDIRDLLFSLVPQARAQMSKMAKSFRGRNEEETCKKIFDYIVANFSYVADRKEQVIKLPSALLKYKVGDCKSYALFTAAILENLKIPYKFVFTSYNSNPIPGHVYVTTDGGCIIDAVYGKFNQEKTPTFKYVQGMNVRYMAGIGSCDNYGNYGRRRGVGATNGTGTSGIQGGKPVRKIALAPGRGLFLGIVKANLDGFATKLQKVNPDKLKKNWENVGGNYSKLVNAIKVGAGKPAKRLGFLGLLRKRIKQQGGVNGIGAANDQAVQAAIVSAATALGAAIGGVGAGVTATVGAVMAAMYPVIKDMVIQTPAVEETDVLVQTPGIVAENDADAVPEGAGPVAPGTQFDFQKALPLVAVAGAALYLATRKKGK
jgi:hypothetical protein